MKNIASQMELGIGRNSITTWAHKQRRQTHAQWWFARMRQIVDLATEWKPAPPPRPTQGSLFSLMLDRQAEVR